MAATSSTSPLPRPHGSSHDVNIIAKKDTKKQALLVSAPLLTTAPETNIMTNNTAPPSKKKKKKRHSPFRIKVGCIVALRYREGGNHMTRADGTAIEKSPTTFYSDVWTDPLPGRDDGLALIGRRVRCCFPKTVLSSSHNASTRVLEGHVISLIDYESQWQQHKSRQRQRLPVHTSVELLVDRLALEAMPFLQQTRTAVDTLNMTSAEKKRQHLEDVIRGKKMVMVQVNLADANRSSCSKGESEHLVAKWVVRKRVPLPMKKGNGENDAKATDTASQNGTTEPPRKKKKSNKDPGKSATLYVGDKNDVQKEQERNWRWLAGRYDDMRLSDEQGVIRPPEQLSCGMIAEVLKVEPTAASTTNGAPSTLATVTLRRMILPEHTISGRLSHHGVVEIFEDADSVIDTEGQQTDSSITFEVPVEELVIVSRKFERKYDTTNDINNGLSCPTVTHSYSYKSNSYRRLVSSSSNDKSDTCHRCRKAEKEGSMEQNDNGKLTCRECREALAPYSKLIAGCDCRACSLDQVMAQESRFREQVEKACADLEENGGATDTDHSAIALAIAAARAMHPSDFCLPPGFMDFSSLPEPSDKLITTSKRARKKPKKVGQKATATEKGSARKKANGKSDSSPRRDAAKVEHMKRVPEPAAETEPDQEDDKVFVPSCSRLLPYDPMRKRTGGSPRRQMGLDTDTSNQEGRKSSAFDDMGRTPTVKQASRNRNREPERMVESKSSSRAARADQRRLKRGVAALGASGIGLDALAGREQQLRFDRSNIHAWGVFADEDINVGDMVVEYRGELIGNAMAEKREAEYMKAKIGSDYMFRIDGTLVCDATKQGNVARFINASCDPNCYTQIITLNGNKRIVIYAKRDIKAGEELCYDYKFPFEHDETKWIPCHCGAKECRGYMNWDKRYVSLTANAIKGAGPENI